MNYKMIVLCAVLIIALAVAAVLAMLAHSFKSGMRGLLIYMQKKGYTPPTEKELRACIREGFGKKSL